MSLGAMLQTSTDLFHLRLSIVNSDYPTWALGNLVKLSDRVLEPVERLSEILFGLIMALTITGAVSVVTADHAQIQTMLFAALGCNLAWGIIDGGMYLMARLGERGRNAVIAQKVREAANPENAHRIIANELPRFSVRSLSEPTGIYTPTNYPRGLFQFPSRSNKTRLAGCAWHFYSCCLSTFLVVIPFIVFKDARVALRTSNALAVLLLFVCGFLFARHAGLWPFTTGVIMVVIGAALVSVAIALGG
jgi:hypothetical protein